MRSGNAPHYLPIVSRRAADVLSEHGSKIGIAAVPALQGNALYGLVCRGEQRLRPRDAAARDVARRRYKELHFVLLAYGRRGKYEGGRVDYIQYDV